MAETGEIESRTDTPKADKGAVMRRRLIRATIEALTELGYSGATTIEVVRRAKVSRGALLHHFPTRSDLLLATTEYIFEAQERFRRHRLKDVDRGRARFLSITDAMWDTMQRPESVALTELMIGTRGDDELREPFAALMRQANARLYEGPSEVAEDIGYADARLVRSMAKLHVAAMRGLMIERHYYGGAEAQTDDAFELLAWYKHAVMRRLADPAFEDAVRLELERPLRTSLGAGEAAVVPMQQCPENQNNQS